MKRVVSRIMSHFLSGVLVCGVIVPMLIPSSYAELTQHQDSFQNTSPSDTQVTEFHDNIVMLGKVGLNNFSKSNNYVSGQFVDVPDDTWYADKIATAYQYGLMYGTSDTVFNPEGNITIAEAIAVACRLHSIYTNNNAEFPNNGVWYQSYVNYALNNHIIAGPYADYSLPISRGEFAIIITGAFPREALSAINTIPDGAVPDVAKINKCYDSVYCLYRAGILSGVDSQGTFKPNDSITRAEVSTVLGNMVDTSLRKTFILEASSLSSTTVISLSSSTLTLKVGQQQTLVPKVTPTNDDMTIIWTSSNPNVASVNRNGVVSGLDAGTTRITAKTSDGASSSCTVTVQKDERQPISLSIVPSSITIGVGETEMISAKADPADIDTEVIWTSSNPNVASVNRNGEVRGVEAGEVRITAETDNGIRAYCTVIVEKTITDTVQPVGISLPRDTTYIKVGQQTTLSCTIYPSNATTKLTWTAMTPDIVSVDQSGNIVGLKEGMGYVSAETDNGMGDFCIVIVEGDGQSSSGGQNSGNMKPTKISLPLATTYIEAGCVENIPLKIYPDGATSKITWSSDRPHIATVDSEGNVAGIRQGWTFIYAETETGRWSSCVVEVTRPTWKISFDKDKVPSQMDLGDRISLSNTLKIEGNPSDSVYTLQWDSGHPDIISVDDDGNIVALSPGKACIYFSVMIGDASYGNNGSGSVIIDVGKGFISPTNVSIPAEVHIKTGEKYNIPVNVYPVDAMYDKICWSIWNNYGGAITTDDFGNIIGIQKGIATVRCEVYYNDSGDIYGDSKGTP